MDVNNTHTSTRTDNEANGDATKKVTKELMRLQDYNRGGPKCSDGDHAMDPASRSRRTGAIKRAKTDNVATNDNDPQTKTTTNDNLTRTKKEQDDLDLCWVCTACKQAECAMVPTCEDFLICEGPCARLFHPPCAGLNHVPSDTWICSDCQQRKHACALCQEYGHDNIDVFHCSKPRCGLFYHESCLQMQNVPITMVRTEEQDNVLLKFHCPAHWCWTCTQDDIIEDQDHQATASKKKRKSKAKSTAVFVPKRDARLFRCIECPNSYHLTCIPPMAKFHELALLCHDHARSHVLPELDLSCSVQGTLEQKLDATFSKWQRKENLLLLRQHRAALDAARKHLGKGSNMNKNPFFPIGLIPDRRTTGEQQFMTKLVTITADDDYDDDDDKSSSAKIFLSTMASGGPNDTLLFCLPCDMKEQVHAKPPHYKHVHSLQYDPNNKPTRIPPSGDICSCVNHCGEDCWNRLTYTECYGNIANQTKSSSTSSKHVNTNCRLGPNCGNRRLGLRQATKCQPQREQGRGWGLVTMEPVPKGSLVQEYLGDVIDEKTKEARLTEWSREHPNDPNFYVMCISQGWYIDARETANLSRFINHSCDPNCILLRVNVGGYMRDGIFALRDLAPGEFLSYDYHFDTKQGDRFVCRCGSKNCRGTMKETNNNSSGNASEAKTKKQQWEQAKMLLEKDKKFVQELEDHEQRNATISCVLPGTEGSISGSAAAVAASGTDTKVAWVSNGVQEKDHNVVVRYRLFLWRNALIGSDFAKRWDHHGHIEQRNNRRLGRRRAAADVKAVQDSVDVLSIIIASNNQV